MKRVLISCMILLTLATTAYAIPNLQLGIQGGTYSNETTSAAGNTFNLYAYLLPNDNNRTTDTYFLSAALIRRDPDQEYAAISKSTASLGTFKIDATTLKVTEDMSYGTPPIEIFYPDLAPHGVFPTFYAEMAFSFAGSTVLPTAINVAKDETQDTAMYRQMFAIDLSNLAEGYGIHFDLYNLSATQKKKGAMNYDLSEFGPYSHDAEGWSIPENPVPEPGTIALLGLGMAGLLVYTRRRPR